MASYCRRNRQRKIGMTLQLPSHVQTNLNKESRLLQQNLMDLDKETKHKMRCIAQDQQVASTKLRILQARLLASQKKFHSLIHAQHVDHNPDEDNTDPDYCFRELMGPMHALGEDGAELRKGREELQGDGNQERVRRRRRETSLRKGDYDEGEGLEEGEGFLKCKTVSFT